MAKQKITKVIEEGKYPADDIIEEVEAPVKKKAVKKYLLENRRGYPYELHVGAFYQRFEPAGKPGSRVEVEEKIVNNPNFQPAIKHLTVTEVK